MKRRDFITLVGGAAAWPVVARAQQERVRRIGILMIVGENDPQGQANREAFEKGLQQLGWIEGANFHLDYRWASGNPERLRTFAEELVRIGADVIIAEGTPALAAARKTTQSIPIVFANVTDPVGQGLVESLARP